MEGNGVSSAAWACSSCCCAWRNHIVAKLLQINWQILVCGEVRCCSAAFHSTVLESSGIQTIFCSRVSLWTTISMTV